MDSAVPSFEGNSEAVSLDGSQQEQVFLTETRVSNKQLPYPQMRGVCTLFSHWFPRGKRFSRAEKESRWKTYKAKIFREYHRLIKGLFSKYITQFI